MNDKRNRPNLPSLPGLCGLEPGDDTNAAAAKHFEEKGRHQRLRLEEQRQRNLTLRALIANLDLNAGAHKRTKADIERREAERTARYDHGDE